MFRILYPGARCRPAFWHGFPVAAVHSNHCFPPSLSLGETNAIFCRPSTIAESQIHRASSMSSVCVMLAALVLLRPTRKCENVVRIFIVLNFLDLFSFPWRLPSQFFGFGGGSISWLAPEGLIKKLSYLWDRKRLQRSPSWERKQTRKFARSTQMGKHKVARSGRATAALEVQHRDDSRWTRDS